MSSKWGVRAWFHGDKIDGLSWGGGASGGDDSISLAFLNHSKTTGKDEHPKMKSAIYMWKPQLPVATASRARKAQLAAEFTRLDHPQ